MVCAQAPVASFEMSEDTLCRNSSLSFINNSENADEYFWDFCLNDLSGSIISSSNKTLSTGTNYYGLELYKNNNLWYGYVVGRGSSNLIRLEFGNSPQNVPSEVSLGNVGGFLNEPLGVSLRQENGVWYGLIINLNNSLVRMRFGDGIDMPPDLVENLGSFGGALNVPLGLEILESDNEVYVVISNYSGHNIGVINFGSSLSNPISGATVDILDLSGTTNGLTGLSMLKSNDLWYGLLGSYNENKLYLLKFTGGLNMVPDIIELADLQQPSKNILVKEGKKVYGFSASSPGRILRVDFGEDLESFTPKLDTVVTLSALESFDIINTGGEFFGFTIMANSGIVNNFDFTASCDGIPYISSSESEPSGFYFEDEGSYLIELSSSNTTGNTSVVCQEVVVLDIEAPDINIEYFSQCLENPVILSPINTSSNITSYSWDFDSDGIEDSSDPNPTYQFPATGTYDVRLTVESDEGCGNFVEQEITIYPEPPTPVFSLTKASFCVGEPVTITNLTDDEAWDGLVEYVWMATDLSDTTSNAPELTFSQPGEKVISVYAQIPGCQSVAVNETIQIIETPVADFASDPVCDGETTVFTNLSESGTILWDFGDGVTSMAANPTHQYSSPGTYQASLTVTNSLGCTNTVMKNVAVNELPQTRFGYDILCENTEIPFQDMSTVDQADIVAWDWFVDGELRSNEQTPLIVFESATDYDIQLLVTSSAGCQSSITETISVSVLPQVDFSTEIGCIGELTSFSDLTDPASVLTRTWMIDGEMYSNANPTHTFNSSGSYDIELTITNNQLCTSVVNKTIVIDELPTPDFTVEGICENEGILLQDVSDESGDPISSRIWSVDGTFIGSGLSIIIEDFPAGTHTFSLVVETENGCVMRVDKVNEIKPKPTAAFTASNNYGVPPFNLSFTNNSQGQSVNEWYVNDLLVTTNPNPVLTFENVGQKTIILITYTAAGCADTAEMMVDVVQPEIDLIISNIELVARGQAYDIAIDVKNASNLPIESLGVNVELQNQFSIAEQVYQRINPDENAVITLGTTVPVNGNNLSYLCISLTSVYEVDDVNVADNEACITIQPRIRHEPPYPNPAITQTKLRYILPNGGVASIYLYDMSGRLEMEKHFENLPKGLNQFVLEVGDLDAGIYFVRFHHEEDVIVSKLVKL